MLDMLPRLIGQSFHECYYLGDMPDDMQAARSSRTGFQGVGVVLSSADPEDLRRELLEAELIILLMIISTIRNYLLMNFHKDRASCAIPATLPRA